MADIEVVNVNEKLPTNAVTIDEATGIPEFIPGEPKKPVNKKLIAIIASIIAGVVIVALVVTVVLMSGVLSANVSGFGSTKEIAKLKPTLTGEGENIAIDESIINNLSVTTLSGGILREGDGDVATIGEQANVNYVLYANIPDGYLQGQQGGTPRWQKVESSWDSNQSMPLTLAAKTLTESNGSSLSSIGNSASSGSGDQTMTGFNDLVVDQKVGTVFAMYIPGTAAASAQSQAQPAMLVLGLVSFVGEVGADPDAPEVSYDAPSNAPVFEFDAAGVPTALNVSDSFEGTDEITVKVLEEGTGDVVAPTDSVKAQYAGYLLDGTQFDASFKHGTEPIMFSLDRVIKGWKYGIAGLKVGTKAELLIPSKWGYGAKGSGETIPPDSFLVFYVDVTGIATEEEIAADEAEQQAAAQSQGGAY